MGEQLKSERFYKRQAKKLKRETGVGHRQCLEEIARHNGFPHWNAMKDGLQKLGLGEVQ